MKRGTKVSVTGAAEFSGIVLVASSDTLVIQVAPGVSTTLRRDGSAMNPLQWHAAGLPVDVRAEEDLSAFRALLTKLERRTRPR